jgi:hypothetical protein
MKFFWEPRLHDDCPHGIDEILPEIVVAAEGSSAGAAAGGLTAGEIATAGAGALAGAGGLIGATGASTSVTNPTTSGGSTGSSSSANPGGNAAKPSTPFFSNLVKGAITSGAGGLASAGASALMGGRRGVTVPPPPGAAMIDPEGAEAAAQIRARQAVAGGLNSTVTGAGVSQPAFSNATSGGKALLGQ